MSKIFLQLLLCFVLFLLNTVLAQISPGELSKAHSFLEGITNCTKCHQLGKQVVNSKCLQCHDEIKNTISNNKGYHSSTEVKNKNCFDCHSEHHGKNFRIINFNKEEFDHSKTTFVLNGAHLKLDCTDCHQSKYITDFKLKNKKNTYLGLRNDCYSCHSDVHNGKFGNNCSVCHNTVSFNDVKSFDHKKTNFELTGAHKSVDCQKCHQVEFKNNNRRKRLVGLNYSNCTPCHSDVHNGRYGADCKSCHNTTSFKVINRNSFDHSKTNFPLIGKHKNISCNKCHKSSVETKLDYSRCSNCHQDYHNGQFKRNQKNYDCKNCHTEDGFSPSLYSIEMHNKSNFILSGAHLAVPCYSCHKKEDKWNFVINNSRCVDCHTNVHLNDLSEKYLKDNNCETCHRTDAWNIITFNHSATGFELLGKHNKTQCRNCHYRYDENGNKIIKFSFTKSECTQCHKDIHYGQFKAENSKENKSICLNCHTFNNWKPEKFDHNKTNFQLQGAHSKLECSKCHFSNTINGDQYVKYKLNEFKCATCHSK